MDSPETISEQRRLEIIAQIKGDAGAAGCPDFDPTSRLAGHLAGPASENRPDVPVWEYSQFAETSGRNMEELAEVRFPIVFFEGESTVTSIEEELRPRPVPWKVRPTTDDVIRHYQTGVLGWESDTRSVQHLKMASEYHGVYRTW